MAKHISEKVNALLLEQGWKVDCKGDCAFHAKKRIEGIAEGGTVSNGARVVQLRMCERGRWLERYDQGLGRVVACVDLRRFSHAETALKEILK